MFKDLSRAYKRMFAGVKEKENKKIKETADTEKFYQVVDNIYYLPPINYLKNNLKDITILNDTFNNYYMSENTVSDDWKVEKLNRRYINKEDEALKMISFLKTQKEIAVDIETTGFSYFEDELLLIVFSYGWNDVIALDVFTDKVIQALQSLFTNNSIKFIWHNGKFDISRLKQYHNLDARVDEDTMLLHYIGFNENRGTHGLGYLAMLYLQAPNWERTLDDIKRKVCRELKIRQSEFNYGMFPKKDLVEYAYYDGLATFRLYKNMKERFDVSREMIYYKLIEAANCFADIERYGVYADQEMIKVLAAKLEKEYIELIGQVDAYIKDLWDPIRYMKETGAKTAPDEFNVNSPQQLKWMFKEQGYNLDSTSVKDLEKIGSEFSELVLKIRKNNKYRKTYVKGLSDAIDSDGRIHSTYNLHGTVTGRLSSSNPNLQNIPRDKIIKNIFRATPGYVFTQADYSQAELRVLAVLSGDEWLQDVYIQGHDLHSRVAEQYWGKDFTSEDRVKAKAVNFGIAYGRTEHTLAPDLNISLSEAKKLLTDWFVPMPKVKKYFDNNCTQALRGNPSVTPFGRVRNFIVTPYNKFSIRNEAMNTPIQGTASDLTVFSLIEIHKELKRRNLGRIVLTVHDSIIVENKPEDADKVAELMIRHMEEVPKKYLKTEVPFAADVDTGILWGELD